MFTGIVESTGTVRALERRGEIVRLVVDTGLDLADTRPGDSIAIDGVCLTVTSAPDGARASFDVGPESLRVTTLGGLRSGDRVHVERALRVGDRLGGHIVQGHVDGVGVVRATRTVGDTLVVDVDAPKSVTALVIVKGSITIAGVSLTVNSFDDEGFSVWLIPHTLEKTHLAALARGARVNLESDVVGKYVQRLLTGGDASSGRATGGVTFDLLRARGFVGADVGDDGRERP